MCVQPCINSLANTGAEARRHGSGVNPHTETHREVDADHVDTEGAGLKKLICITVIVPLIKGIAEEVEVTKLVAVLLIITVYVFNRKRSQ